MISVIVPVYNIRKYLPRCIESILAQTLSELEVLLVNDGSTDGCYEICESYRRQDSRIKVIHKVNGGLVSARKAGMKAASGDYIAFVDGDDWIEPDMYERMYQKLMEQDVDIVMCGRYEDVGDISKRVYHGIPEGRYGKEEMLRAVYHQMISKGDFFEYGILPVIWDKLFRRDRHGGGRGLRLPMSPERGQHLRDARMPVPLPAGHHVHHKAGAGQKPGEGAVPHPA